MPVTPVPQKVWRAWPNMSHCANEITQLVIFVARQSVDINFELWLYRLQPWMAMGQPLRHLVSMEQWS